MSTDYSKLKVNISKLKKQFVTDNPLINDLIYAGVSQFLGIQRGPIELAGVDTTMPNTAMLQFLQDMEILVSEEVNQEKESLIHS